MGQERHHRDFKKGEKVHMESRGYRTPSSVDIFIRDVSEHFGVRFAESDYKYILNQLHARFQRGVTKVVLLKPGTPSTYVIPWNKEHIVFTYDTKHKRMDLLTDHSVEVITQETGTLYRYNGNETFVTASTRSLTTPLRD